MTNDTTRRERGIEALTRIHGERGLGYVAALREFAPDMADLLVDFPYGDIYSRPGLDPKSRQLATIAALTVLGDAHHELTIHIGSALGCGCTSLVYRIFVHAKRGCAYDAEPVSIPVGKCSSTGSNTPARRDNNSIARR